MSDLVVHEPQQQLSVLTNEQLQYISGTEFVPRDLRGNLPAILACVATGRALGIPDMVALRSIHIIDGRATFSAELLVQLVRRQGHSIIGDVTEGVARIVGTRADNGDTMTVEWTLAMAERAGLTGKSNWKKYPEAMLWARGVSQLCRMLFPDCFAGATYTPEELEDSVGAASQPPQHDPPPAAPAENDVPFLEPDETVREPGPNDDKPATDAQKRKLDVLVKGTVKPPLRRVYATVARMRVRSTDALILEVGGMGEDAELHWTPLRDSLTRAEAHDLIDRLEKLEPQA